jgi:hypothetical protein
MKDGIIYRKPRLIKKDKNMQVQKSLMKHMSLKTRSMLLYQCMRWMEVATHLLPSQFFKIA